MKSQYIITGVVVSLITWLAGGAAAKKPVPVFLLVGQSNMQGHAHVRTLDYIGMDSRTRPLLQAIRDESGKARINDNVWISYLSSGGEKSGRLTTGFGANKDKIGPELTFGIYMQRRLKEPILIIKTAWGGKSLHTDFRPPSAGPYTFNKQMLARFEKQNKDIARIKADKAKRTGHYYRLTIAHVKKVLANVKQVYPDYDAEQGYKLSGIVWFQGWNDMVDRGTYPNRNRDGGYDPYSQLMAHFIRDIRRDLQAPRLPFVIGVMGVGGPVAEYTGGRRRYAKIHQNFRSAMAAPAQLPEFKGNVVAVLTENYWDQPLVKLRERDAKIRRQVRKLRSEKKITRKQERATMARLRAKEFTKRELQALKTGASNFEFHYLGSAKIMAQIGKGFAEAMPIAK